MTVTSDPAYTARHAAINAEVEADFAANGPQVTATARAADPIHLGEPEEVLSAQHARTGDDQRLLQAQRGLLNKLFKRGW